MYDYTAKCVRVVDGDTVDLQVNLGFHLTFTDRFRLYGIDAPELRGWEAPEGQKSMAWLCNRLFTSEGVARDLEIVTIKSSRAMWSQDKRGKYGRWLVKILDPDAFGIRDTPSVESVVSTLNAQMIAEGLAQPAAY